MVTATPNMLGDVLGQIVQAAADAAAAVPQDLQNVFDQAGRTVADVVDEAQALPANALAQLKQLIDPPDWASLLIFILVKISELDPAHLSVGSMRPDGWSRTLTLTYTLESGKKVTVGFAMTDPAPAKHGFILKATDWPRDGGRPDQPADVLGLEFGRRQLDDGVLRRPRKASGAARRSMPACSGTRRSTWVTRRPGSA